MAVSRSTLSPAGILFPKHTDLICIFNQCSNRARRPSSWLSLVFPFDLPGILFPREEFPARGLPSEIRYSQFRPTVAGIGRERLLVCFPPTLRRFPTPSLLPSSFSTSSLSSLPTALFRFFPYPFPILFRSLFIPPVQFGSVRIGSTRSRRLARWKETRFRFSPNFRGNFSASPVTRMARDCLLA